MNLGILVKFSQKYYKLKPNFFEKTKTGFCESPNLKSTLNNSMNEDE